ncbi:MAG: putative Serine/Threonine kinase domain protein [Streblomastix strix]|uniref:Putative Serine/Threonine kinase domain protein n=1 Tax=Streblomastix strix TaxID=222440 RepID=A0A5J4V760_9EUKA|nr:MAG: putative Serine/Threonine kinase domain protein [Streblomastix strix]
MKQILEGVKHIHSKRIIHRDIKPANIMMHSPLNSQRVVLFIADFGYVKLQTCISANLISAAGTSVYMAPELLLGDEQQLKEADSKIDIWSVGILLYQMTSHKFPFRSPTQNVIQKFMEKYSQTGILDRPNSIKDDILWDLIEKMLAFDRHDRISAIDALNHPFFTGEQAKAEITDDPKDSWTCQS